MVDELNIRLKPCLIAKSEEVHDKGSEGAQNKPDGLSNKIAARSSRV